MAESDLVVEVSGDWGLGDFCNFVGGDSERLDGGDPVLDVELALLLLDDLIQLFDGLVV